MAEQIGPILTRPEIAAKACDDVGDVSFAFAQVRIVTAVEERGNLRQRCLQRGLGVDPVFRDDFCSPVDQHPVVEHQQLRVEQVGMIVAGAGGDPRLDLCQLLPGCFASGMKTRDLVRDSPCRHTEADVAAAAVEDHGAPDTHPRGYTESGQTHGASSNPRSTSPHRPATASRSSLPSA